ncbi:killer cell lectin-like receptor subfamily F member 2 [Ochotona princeps]|uniref:killer cell lectin-like receptor subfamily F member 2 n=1 Tax=Ochotona princeps TaxID=9978 RepID=UPI00032AF2B7|nr:killer cell lectin-like receptor subfamily F member 2 [Ochotona princeps]
MENEDGYMSLNLKDRLKSREGLKGISPSLQRYCCMVLCGCIGILIFLVTMIGLKFWGEISVCPKDWLLNQGKCYWLSTSFKTWRESQHECAQWRAHLLLIRNLDELRFVQSSLKRGYLGWIGLYGTAQGRPWRWIDEQAFVPQLFSVIGPQDDRSCGILTGRQVYSEDCDSTFNAICQRDAVCCPHNRSIGGV